MSGGGDKSGTKGVLLVWLFRTSGCRCPAVN